MIPSQSRRASTMVIEGGSGNIRVAVRVRPFNSREQAEDGGSKSVVKCNGSNVEVFGVDGTEARHKSFNYDLVFDNEIEQDGVFEAIGGPVIDDAIGAYNGCIFAYGQTGSGKTHSMVGDTSSLELQGILPRACTRLFESLAEKGTTTQNFQATVLASYLEIYNEKIYDLLSSGNREELEIRLHPQFGAIVTKLTECPMLSMEECKELFDFGTKKRAVAATQMNATSSRSHAVFTVQVRTQYKSSAGATVESQAKIHFVDLAGSERMKKTGATGDRMREGIGINQALSVLGRVISDLSSAPVGKKMLPPFRESKLTLLLKDALMGNSRTVLLACISPSAFNVEESVSTLEFAARCKLVRTSAQKNEQTRADIIAKLTGEKEEVEAQLRAEQARREELMLRLQQELEKAMENERKANEALAQKLAIEGALQRMEEENSDLAAARDDAMAAMDMIAAEAAANAEAAAAATAESAANAAKALAAAEQAAAAAAAKAEMSEKADKPPPEPPTGSFIIRSPEYLKKLQEKEELEAKLRELEEQRKARTNEEKCALEAARQALEREINEKNEKERELTAQREALLAAQDSWAIDRENANRKAEEEKQKRKAELSKLGMDFLDLDEQEAAKAPQLVNLHPDPSLERCLVYYLPIGKTIAGSDEKKCRVRLTGLSIQGEVCVLENKDHKTLTVQAVSGGLVRVNGSPLEKGGRDLKDGDRLALGRDKIFQVCIPQAPQPQKAQADFTKAMEELAAGTNVNKEWQNALEMIMLMVKTHLGQEVATKLMKEAKRGTEHINQANDMLREIPPKWRDDISRYELSVMFEMTKGLPQVCVAAYTGASGNALATWTLDTFVNEKLPQLQDLRSQGDVQDSAEVAGYFHKGSEVWYTIRLRGVYESHFNMRLCDFEEMDRSLRPECHGRLPPLPDGGKLGFRAWLDLGNKNRQIQERLQFYVKAMKDLEKLDYFMRYMNLYDSITSPTSSPTKMMALSPSRNSEHSNNSLTVPGGFSIPRSHSAQGGSSYWGGPDSPEGESRFVWYRQHRR